MIWLESQLKSRNLRGERRECMTPHPQPLSHAVGEGRALRGERRARGGALTPGPSPTRWERGEPSYAENSSNSQRWESAGC